MKTKEGYQLLNNSRFYILTFSFLLSVGIFAWLRLQIESDQLLSIRTQQMYGFICLGFWYLALIIAPIGRVIGRQRTNHLAFARRAIGVSAFYFALLHVVIALFGQLGGISQIQHLPDLFKWSLLFGGTSLVVLGLMAATSFDSAIRFMTFRKWKWLHRFVYIAAVFVILHIWMIGTHLAYTAVQLASFGALAILIGLELYCTSKLINEKYLHLSRSEMITLFVGLWVVALLSLAALPLLVQNYHSRHTTHSGEVQ